MKKLFVITLLLCISCFVEGQEIQSVTESLKGKYDFSYYSYDEVTKFGYYPVQRGNLWGVCNNNGKEIVPCQFSRVVYYNGYFDVEKGLEIGTDGILEIYAGPFGVYDKDGKVVIPCIYANPYMAYQIAFNQTGFVIVNKGGEITTDRRVKGGKWGMIDMNGNVVVPFEYEAILQPTEGLAAICKGGEGVYEPYMNAQKVYSGGKWGFFDIKARQIAVPVEFDKVTSFKQGASMVSKAGVSKLINNPISGKKANIAADFKETVKSDIDENIPVSNKKDDNTFAFIFSVEQYSNQLNATAANSDGRVFKDYCINTLGIENNNISFYEDGTFAQLHSMLKRISDIKEVVDDDAMFIVYFSGLGLTDTDATSYLLPSDFSLSNVKATAYKLSDLCRELSTLPSVLLIVDAPFDGKDRNGRNILSGRSVAIKAKMPSAAGNSAMLFASSGNGVARVNRDNNHGLLTYHFLKIMKETKGDINYGDLLNSTATTVSKHSIKNTNQTIQKPLLITSENCKLIKEKVIEK